MTFLLRYVRYTWVKLQHMWGILLVEQRFNNTIGGECLIVFMFLPTIHVHARYIKAMSLIMFICSTFELELERQA